MILGSPQPRPLTGLECRAPCAQHSTLKNLLCRAVGFRSKINLGANCFGGQIGLGGNLFWGLFASGGFCPR